MQENNSQLVLNLANYEKEFILDAAKKTNLSVSELIVLSILALRLPLGKKANYDLHTAVFRE